MTLIQAIREARKNGHNWMAIDQSRQSFSYLDKPVESHNQPYWYNYSKSEYLGIVKLSCNWRGTLIKLSKIKVQ